MSLVIQSNAGQAFAFSSNIFSPRSVDEIDRGEPEKTRQRRTERRKDGKSHRVKPTLPSLNEKSLTELSPSLDLS